MRDAVLLHGVAGHNYRKVAVEAAPSAKGQVRVEARRPQRAGRAERYDEAPHRWRLSASQSSRLVRRTRTVSWRYHSWRPELNSKATLSRLLPLIAASWATAGGAEEAAALSGNSSYVQSTGAKSLTDAGIRRLRCST